MQSQPKRFFYIEDFPSPNRRIRSKISDRKWTSCPECGSAKIVPLDRAGESYGCMGCGTSFGKNTNMGPDYSRINIAKRVP